MSVVSLEIKSRRALAGETLFGDRDPMVPRSRRLILAVGLISGLTTGPGFAADTSYRDPRQPSFTLLVPDGWTLTRNDQGVKLNRGTTWVQLVVQKGTGQPGAILVQTRPQFERQWKNFREIGSGDVSFGGQKGAYAVYAGVPPSGANAITKLVTMTDGRLTYMLFMEAHADEYDRVKRDMERIQASFSPDPVR
jgi:hypothetical protein